MADPPADRSESAPPAGPAAASAGPALNRGPGRVLVAVYLLFAIAASSRAGLQIVTRFDEAPLAYLLSAFAALVYVAATVGLALDSPAGRRLAGACCTVELVGVVVVGLLSRVLPRLFPDDTVWSDFGRGYGFVPLVLPVIGLLWLRRTRPGR